MIRARVGDVRRELLYTPHLFLERLLKGATRRHRRRRLRRTPARTLRIDHVDSLELLDIVQRELTPQCIYDIGANRGTWSLLARTLCPQATVQAFEPLDDLRAEFLRVVAPVGQVTLHSIALGASTGSREMFVHRFADASSFLPLTSGEAQRWADHLQEKRELDVSSLDDYVEGHGLPMADLMKLDVQGYEIEVLKGATRALRQARAIISEVSFREVYAGQPLFGTFAGFLAAAGFEPVAFSQSMTTGAVLEQCDVLFLRA